MHSLLFLVPIFRELVRISYAYRAAILLTSVVVVIAFAMILMSSKEARRLAGSWVKYVGWAFLAYGFQYVFRLISWLIRNTEGDFLRFVKISCNFLANFGSGANNLFFLAAALILLDRRTPFLKPRIFIAIVTTTAVLTTAANFYFVEKDFPWSASFARLPDALISAFCLGLFGYSMMRNFLTHHRRYWAIVVILIGLIYGSIQLVYAANPVLAKMRGSQIQSVLNTARYSPRPSDPVEFLDSSIFAVALPLKMLLFVPAFYLFFTLVIAAHDFRKVLRVVTEQKKSYLSSDGIVQAIGESVAAGSVEVFIKLPGTKPSSAWCISWPRKDSLADHELQFILLEPDAKVDPGLLKVLSGKAEIPVHDSGDRLRQLHTSLMPESTEHLAMLPVKFHGAVIGCLKVKFRHSRDLNYAAIQQLNSMADLLGPALQDYRALASLDQLSGRFGRLQVQKPGAEFKKMIQEMGEILHDVLSPLAMGLLVEAGFRANHILEGEGEFRRLLEGQTVRYEPEDLTTEVIRTDVGDVKIYKNQLMVTSRDGVFNGFPIGNLVLILPSEHDEINRPTLGDYGLHRHTIASHTADAFLDLVRDHLRYELSMLSIKLNAEALTREAWLKGIQEMSENIGLLWVGVTKTGNSKPWGDTFAEELIPQLDQEARRELEAKPLSCVVYDDEITQTHHIMRIELTKSGHQIWFGIAREGFGLELDFPSPWKVFLEDFKEIVDSALASLFEVMKSKETLAKLAEDRGVMNIAITTGHLMHELANKVDEQLFPADSLWQAIKREEINVDDVQRTQVRAILNSAKVMKDLIAIFKNVTKADDRRVYSLREVVTRATQFYEHLMVSADIKFRNNVKDEVRIDMRFDVALFAIANLVGNSKEAIEKRMKDVKDGYVGEIRIEAKSDEDFVTCYVTDNGAGIPEHIKEKLYILGSSDKKGHNGWGLYFTNRALGENGGEIKMIASNPGLTKFSIKFPKAKSP